MSLHDTSTKSDPLGSLEGCVTEEENVSQWMLQNKFTQNMKSKIIEKSDLRGIAEHLNFNPIEIVKFIKGVKTLSNAIINEKKSYITISKNEQKLLDKIKQEINDVKNLSDSNVNIIKKLENNYDLTKNEINKIFNELENVLLNELENVKNSKIKNLKKQIKECGNYINVIKQCGKQQDEVLENSSLTSEQREKEMKKVTNRSINNKFKKVSCENDSTLFTNENHNKVLNVLQSYGNINSSSVNSDFTESKQEYKITNWHIEMQLKLKLPTDSQHWTYGKDPSTLLKDDNSYFSTRTYNSIIFESHHLFSKLTKVKIRNSVGMKAVKSFKLHITDNINSNNWVKYSLQNNHKFDNNSNNEQSCLVNLNNSNDKNLNKRYKFIQVTFTENYGDIQTKLYTFKAFAI